VDVNVPGVMAILVAPLVSQLSVLPVPGLMLAGAAVKEVIAGAEPAPENEFDCIVAVQPASPTQANAISTIAQGSSPEARILRVLSPILQNEPAESMRSPLVVVDGIILATPPSSQSVFQKFHGSQSMTLVMTKMVGKQTELRFFDNERWMGPEKRTQTPPASSDPSPVGGRKIPVAWPTFR
jgi:hypothetical protein